MYSTIPKAPRRGGGLFRFLFLSLLRMFDYSSRDRLQGKQGAFEPRGTEFDAQHFHDLVRSDGREFIGRLARGFVGEQRGAGLADRATMPLVRHTGNLPIAHFAVHRHFISTGRIDLVPRPCRTLQDALVQGVLVQVQDLLVVEVQGKMTNDEFQMTTEG